MISNVGQLSVSHSFSRLLKLTVIGSYAYNESTPVKAFTSKIYNTSAVLDYRLTQSTKLSLSQEYSHFDRTAVPVFDKLVTMLMVSTEWH